MTTTITSYQRIVANFSRTQATAAAEPAVANATAYFKAHMGSVTSIKEFVGNYRLFTYAMKAYGLSDMTYATGFVQKVLEGGVANSKSLANTLSDSRFKAFAKAFDFAGAGAASAASRETIAATVSKYVEQTVEDNAGAQDEGVQLALYFRRNASDIKSGYGVLADKALLRVVQTAYGIPASSSAQNIDLQAQTIEKKLAIKDLTDPAKVNKIVQRFAANWDLENGASASGSTTAITSRPVSYGLGNDLLLSIQKQRLGGA